MAFTKQAILLLVLALLALSAFANPLEDVSNTSVDLDIAEEANIEYLTVTITRVDDLFTDEGDLLAERRIAVEISFEVVADVVCLNGNPLIPGVSSITISGAILASAETMATSSDETIPDTTDELVNAFDVGLVTIEVATVVEYAVAEDGITPIRRITVTEQVVEVEGATVIMTDIRQQILEIALDGTGGILKFVPVVLAVEATTVEATLLDPASLTDEQLAGLLGQTEVAPCRSSPLERAKEWWASLSTRQRTFLSFFTSFWFTFSFLLVALSMSRMKRHSRCGGYAPPCEQSAEEAKLDSVEVLFEGEEMEEEVDEKRSLLRVE